MIRRQARLRREFIYRRSLEEKQDAIQSRRNRVKEALAKNSAIPTDLRKDAIKLADKIPWGNQIDDVDDEYRWAGCEDPNVIITTSRNPSSRLKMFSKVCFIKSSWVCREFFLFTAILLSLFLMQRFF